jgi:hypothetical protein
MNLNFLSITAVFLSFIHFQTKPLCISIRHPEYPVVIVLTWRLFIYAGQSPQ